MVGLIIGEGFSSLKASQLNVWLFYLMKVAALGVDEHIELFVWLRTLAARHAIIACLC